MRDEILYLTDNDSDIGYFDEEFMQEKNEDKKQKSEENLWFKILETIKNEEKTPKL